MSLCGIFFRQIKKYEKNNILKTENRGIQHNISKKIENIPYIDEHRFFYMIVYKYKEAGGII